MGPIIIIFYILLLSKYCCATNITIYDWAYFKGESVDFQISNNSECHNVPIEWDNRASGMHTHDMCVELYATWNCTGERWIRLYPGNFGHHALYTWGFDNVMKSIKACDKSISLQNYLSEGDSVAFFEKNNTDRTGAFFNMNVHSCKNLPPKWRNCSSSLVSFTRCYVFYSDLNCSGKSLMVPANSTYAVDSFLEWDFDKQINSVNICTSDIDMTSVDKVYISAVSVPVPLNNNSTNNLTNQTGKISENPPTSGTTIHVHVNNDSTREATIAISLAVVLFFMLLLTIAIAGLVLIFLYIHYRKRLSNSFGGVTTTGFSLSKMPSLI